MKISKDLVYCINCLLFSIIIGAGVYEHLAVWPSAYAALPKSLTMFQGEYRLDAGAFWPRIHPITLLSFLVSTAIFWKSQRRNFVLVAFTGYVIVLVITFAYFVPELISINATEYVSEVSEELTRRGSKWEFLSLLRLGFLTILTIVLYLGLTRDGGNRRRLDSSNG